MLKGGIYSMVIDYEKDVSINPDALDVEWLEQPQLMLKYGKLAAYTKLEADRAKERLEVIKAELDKDIRMNPDKYDITKITESVVINTILLQPEYQAANEEYIKLNYEAALARYTVQAIDTKKEALENLVKLYGMQYFAGPSVPRDLSSEWQVMKKQESANSKIEIRRSKTKKE